MELKREFVLYCPTYNGYWYAVKGKEGFYKPPITVDGMILQDYTPYTMNGVIKKGIELGKQGYRLEVHRIIRREDGTKTCIEVPKLTVELCEQIRIAEQKMFDDILKNRNR